MAKTRDHDPAQPRAGKPGSLLGLALGAGALVGGLAWWAGRKAREAEQVNPPLGNFIDVSDMRLHHLVRGQGRPVVLLHGLGGMVQDWHLSLLDRAGREFRCIAFDRPGYGHSPRPAGRRWTPGAQAELLRRAVRRLGAEPPVLVGHDFGALVALAWGLDYPEDVAGIVLLSGWFYPPGRSDLPLAGLTGAAGLAGLAGSAVAPLVGRQMLPKLYERLFAPNAVPSIFSLYPGEMMLRPGQMRAQGEDLGHLVEATRGLSPRYPELRVPVIIMAGESDQVVDPVAQSVRLHRDIRHSALRVIPECGHMPHHTAPAEVVAAIELAWHEADVQTRATIGQRPAARGDGEDEAPAAMI